MFYKKNLDITNAKECFDFLTTHYHYDTMNSWNGLKSIANNVKVYNLKLEGDEWNALALLEADNYFNVNMMIEDWEYEHKGYKVGFNGRSGGYLVLYNENNNSNILPDEIIHNTYEEFKNYCKDYYGGVKYYRDLRYLTELVRDFDKLCDEIRDFVNELSKRDPIKDIVNNKLELFNDEYYNELKEFNLPEFELSENNTITITQEARKHKSLVDCLINYLNNDAYNVNTDTGLIIIDAN